MKKNYFAAAAFLLFGALNLQAQNGPCITNLGGDVEPAFVTLNVVSTTFNHNTFTAQEEYYNSYPQSGSTTTTLVAGQQYQIYTFTSSEAIVGMWIDYNQNDEFEESEFTLLVNSMTIRNTSNFSVSPDALSGNTKVRFRSRAFGSGITGANACTSFGSGETRDYIITVTSELSVNELEKANTVSVYPNPSSDIVTVGDAQSIKSVELYNISGNLVATRSSNVLDISGYASGVYFVKATNANGHISHAKIVKQ